MDLKKYLHTEFARKNGQRSPIRLKHLSREYIPELLAKFGAKKGAEVGVAEGHFSELLCQKIPELELICVDLWQEGDDKKSKEKGQKAHEYSYEQSKKKLAPFNATLIKGNSTDVVREVPLESLDFVYIDACHEFDYVIEDIVEWSKRVKKGGLVAGHDYYHFRNAGVIEAVDTYSRAHGIDEVFLTNEIAASWFWCK